MAHSYSIDSESGIVEVEVWGRDSVRAAQQRVRDILADPGWRSGMSVLIDMTRVDALEADYMKSLEIRDQHVSLSDILGGGRVALVAADDAVYGVLRMWQTLSDGQISQPVGVFRDLESARAWMSGPEPR